MPSTLHYTPLQFNTTTMKSLMHLLKKTSSVPITKTSSKFTFLVKTILCFIFLLSLTSLVFATATDSYLNDSNNVKNKARRTKNGDKDNVKISVPSKKSVLWADYEMHINMQSFLQRELHPILDRISMEKADEEITEHFYQEFQLFMQHVEINRADNDITAKFYSEEVSITPERD